MLNNLRVHFLTQYNSLKAIYFFSYSTTVLKNFKNFINYFKLVLSLSFCVFDMTMRSFHQLSTYAVGAYVSLVENEFSILKLGD